MARKQKPNGSVAVGALSLLSMGCAWRDETVDTTTPERQLDTVNNTCLENRR